MKRRTYIAAMFLVTLVALSVGITLLDRKAAVEAAGPEAPRFEVDPLWPKPLPNHWVIGATIGVSVDAQDNVWIIHRPASLEPKEIYAAANPPAASCCTPAPPVLVFNAAGDLISHWGGPGKGYDWPESNHGVTVDHKGNVWIGGNGATDAHALKFTREGKFLMQIGKPKQSKGSNDTQNLKRAAELWVDKATNELYVADGYGNKRVIVFDADTGKYKRHWGAYGNKPDDTDLGPYDPAAPPAKQFRSPMHSVDVSNDGLVYATDRANDRLQVFKRDGSFVKEVFIAKQTRGDGAVWDSAFSKDPQQRFIYIADGANEKVYILERNSLELLTSFGDGGRQPGQFYAIHGLAVDSKGNIYTTETYRGQRVQKFAFKGLAPVTKKDQGTVWPTTSAKK
jgi:DNA-binding beta-propeller fold protein YncE